MDYQSNSIQAIFDQFEQDQLTVWSIIDMFQTGRDIRDLEIILKERPRLANNILYITSELSPNLVNPIWGAISKFVSSKDLNTVYYSLDTMEGMLSYIDKNEVLSLLDEVIVREASIDKKINSIKRALQP